MASPRPPSDVRTAFVEARYDADRRLRLERFEARAIERVGVGEARDVGEAPLCDQRGAIADVRLAVVAQHDRVGTRAGVGDRVEDIAAVAGGNVDDMDGPPVRAQPRHRLAEQLLDAELALPDATPTHRVEIDTIEQTAQRRGGTQD